MSDNNWDNFTLNLVNLAIRKPVSSSIFFDKRHLAYYLFSFHDTAKLFSKVEEKKFFSRFIFLRKQFSKVFLQFSL